VAEHVADLTIIGAGPAGLYAAYYAGFRALDTVVIDSLPEPGGQIAALYPEKAIFDVAGFPSVKGQELVDRLVEQAAAFTPNYLLNNRADTVEELPQGGFRITTHRGEAITTKAVLITGGIGTFTPRPMPDATDFEGRGLVYFVREFDTMRDRDVLIVGGGDSAVDWALNLEGIAKSITLIHRRDRFRAHEASVEQLMNSTVRVMTNFELAKIEGADAVERAVVFDNRDDSRETLQVDRIIAALGFTSDLGPVKTWGLELDGRQIAVDTAMQTNIPGIYAAGDITEYPGKVRLISVGFGEAATAVNNAAVFIDPSARVFPGHSSGSEQVPAGVA
jgi:thioredoxin reductase (NADPH)